jgi:hypothetical protein
VSAVQPYTKEFTLTATGGATASVEELRFPARGTLKRIIASVTNGVGAAGTTGTIKLFSSEDGADDNDPIYLIATITLTGNVYDSGAVGIDYTNREGSHSVQVRKLYARIELADSGPKTAVVSLTVEQPQH